MTALEDLVRGKWYTLLYKNTDGKRNCIRGEFIRRGIDHSGFVQATPVLLVWFLFPVYPQTDAPSLRNHISFFRFSDIICAWEEPA